MGFAVIHIEKGTSGKAGGLGAHIDRTKRVLNADPSKQHLNFYVRPNYENNTAELWKNAEKKDLQTRINDRIKDGYKGKTAIRKDAVTHLNIVMSGSHEEMIEIAGNQKKLEQWAATNYVFAVKRYGVQNVVEFCVHMEERTPHIHCVVVPLTPDGRLSAKEIMGDKRKMSRLQDDYGKLMDEKFGLKRGIKGSTATHDSVREYYGRIEERLRYPSNSMELNYETKAPRIETPPLINREKWTEKQNKAISEDFTRLREHYKHEAEKQSQKVLNYFQNAKLQAEEEADRLRKKNSQLKGLIEQKQKEINRLKHPEQTNTQNRGFKLS